MINKFRKILDFFLPLFFSKTAKNTYFVSVGNIFGLIFAFAFNVIAGKTLSWSDFGYVSGMWALLLLISDVADLGIGSSLSRFLPPLDSDKNKLFDFLKTAFIFQLSIASFLFIAVFTCSSYLATNLFHNPHLSDLVKVTAVGIFGTIVSNFLFYALSAKQQFKAASIVTILNGGLRLLFLIILMILSLVSLKYVVWAQSYSYIILIILSFCFLKISFLHAKWNLSDLKKLLSFTYFLAIAKSLSALAGRLDVLMLINLLNPKIAPIEAGIYALAAKFLAPYPLFSGSFSTVIAPKLSTVTDLNHLKSFLKKVTLATLGLITTIFIFMVIAEPFLGFFLKEKAIPMIPVLRVLLISQIFFVGSIPAVNVAIYFLKRPNILTINSVLQVIIVFLSNLVLIPKYGRFAPAFSLIAAYGITLATTSLMTYYYFRKKYE